MSDQRLLAFEVIGVAAPKGSTRSFVRKRKDGTPYAATTNDNPRTSGWQTTIANCAALELARAGQDGKFFEGPVVLEAWFYLPRPKALLTKKRAAEHVPHTVKPDLDKLARALKDALTGVCWTDDAQVVDLFVHKRYCAPNQWPRALITIREAQRPAPALLGVSV